MGVVRRFNIRTNNLPFSPIARVVRLKRGRPCRLQFNGYYVICLLNFMNRCNRNDLCELTPMPRRYNYTRINYIKQNIFLLLRS